MKRTKEREATYHLLLDAVEGVPALTEDTANPKKAHIGAGNLFFQDRTDNTAVEGKIIEFLQRVGLEANAFINSTPQYLQFECQDSTPQYLLLTPL